MAGAHGGCGLAIDQHTKRVAVAVEDGLDDPKRLIVARRFGASVAGCGAIEGDG